MFTVLLSQNLSLALNMQMKPINSETSIALAFDILDEVGRGNVCSYEV